jgi:CheY-like chemotaxis protein
LTVPATHSIEEGERIADGLRDNGIRRPFIESCESKEASEMTPTEWPATCILIVEDDVEMRESLGEILRDEGYRVAAAANGREALRHLQEADPPCLILLDLMMPEMTGWEFRDHQRRDPQLAQIPVAIMTGVRNSMHQIAALEAVGYFQKPVDLEALLRTISRYC